MRPLKETPTRFRSAGLLPIVLLGLAATSCAHPAFGPPSDAPAARARVADRLYFGRSISGGGTVTEQDWATFLGEVVTPRFPEGLTVWRAEGQWGESSGAVVREPTMVLELIRPADARSEAAVQEISAEYKRRFGQEAVLWVRDRVEATP